MRGLATPQHGIRDVEHQRLLGLRLSLTFPEAMDPQLPGTALRCHGKFVLYVRAHPKEQPCAFRYIFTRFPGGTPLDLWQTPPPPRLGGFTFHFFCVVGASIGAARTPRPDKIHQGKTTGCEFSVVGFRIESGPTAAARLCAPPSRPERNLHSDV